MPPLISIIMPVYNAEKYLKEAIDSILCQTITDFEFLIFNDGSNDKSSDIILSYNDPRIIFFNQEYNSGYVKHLNKGIELSKGKYIARMDADDICDPKRFEKQVEILDNNPSIGLCSSWYDAIGNDFKFKYQEHHKQICSQMMFSNPICHPVVMMRKQVLIDFDLKYEEKYVPAEDYLLWTKLSKVSQLYNLQEFLLHYRMHEGQISSYKKEVQEFNIRKCQLNIIFEQLNSINENDQAILSEIFFTKNKYITTNQLLEIAIIFHKAIKENNSKNVFEKNLLLKYCNEKWLEKYREIKEYYPSGIKIFSSIFFSLLTFNQRLSFILNCLIYRKSNLSVFWSKLFDFLFWLNIEKKVKYGRNQFKLFKLRKKIQGENLFIGSNTDIVIDDEAEVTLGKNVTFGKNCHIKVEKNGILSASNNVTFNDYSSIGFKTDNKHSEIVIGENTEFSKHCSLLVYPNAKIQIEKNVFMNNYCSLNCLEKIEIGENTLLGEGVKIYDHNHIFKSDSGVQLKRYEFTTKPVKIGSSCWIGSNVTILQGVEIGNNSVISANTVVYKSVPEGSIIKSNN